MFFVATRKIQFNNGSLSVVIPSLLAEQCGLQKGSKVKIEKREEGILIKNNMFADVEEGLRKGAEQIRKELQGRK